VVTIKVTIWNSNDVSLYVKESCLIKKQLRESTAELLSIIQSHCMSTLILKNLLNSALETIRIDTSIVCRMNCLAVSMG